MREPAAEETGGTSPGSRVAGLREGSWGGSLVPLRPAFRVPRRIVEKPWGREVYVAQSPYYVAKIVYIDRNETMSKHFHEQRHETLHFLTPDATLEVEYPSGEKESVHPDVGESFTIEPGVKHRIAAGPLGARIFEVSTPQPDDVVRVDDPWARQRLSEDPHNKHR